jgi:RimJ/RimL family protein N-acetyltransferase
MKALVFDQHLIGEWVKSKMSLPVEWGKEYRAIGWSRNDKIFCGVVYNHYSGTDIAMHVAGEGQWATPAVLRAFFFYPFVQLKCQRVTALVGLKNARCLTLVERLGFVPEGRMREGLPGDDLMIFGMLRRECRWLEGCDGKVD